MGANKHDVIKMGAYIHGVLILCGCLLPRFYGNFKNARFILLQVHYTKNKMFKQTENATQ